MNGAHDLGGRMGFGPVAAPVSEPVFGAEWEKRVVGLSFAYQWSFDEYRAAIESMHPADYLKTSYYEHWLHGLEQMVKNLISQEPVKSGSAAAAVAGGNYSRELATVPSFKIGQSIRVKMLNPQTHTRAPRYVRGHVGKVACIHGAHVFPDSNALGQGENPQWLYSIRFTAHEIWNHSNRDLIYADLWEPYLESA